MQDKIRIHSFEISRISSKQATSAIKGYIRKSTKNLVKKKYLQLSPGPLKLVVLNRVTLPLLIGGSLNSLLLKYQLVFTFILKTFHTLFYSSQKHFNFDNFGLQALLSSTEVGRCHP